MLLCLILALAGTIPGQAEFKADSVLICVDIHSSIYNYKLTNLGTSPIVGF